MLKLTSHLQWKATFWLQKGQWSLLAGYTVIHYHSVLHSVLRVVFHRQKSRVRAKYHSAFSSEGALSEEEDNEENTSEHSVRNTPDQLLSSLSAENLQMELSKCSSDGLSDKENVVRNLKNQVKHAVEKLAPPVSQHYLSRDFSQINTRE